MNHIISNFESIAELFNNIITNETWCSVNSLDYEDTYIEQEPVSGPVYQTSCKINGKHCTIYFYKIGIEEMPAGTTCSSSNHTSQYSYRTIVKCDLSEPGHVISRDFFNRLNQEKLRESYSSIQQD